MVLILFTLSLQYVYELLLFFPEKKIGHPTNPPLENAMPHQLSGCKYNNVIPTPQNVLGYFFKIFALN